MFNTIKSHLGFGPPGEVLNNEAAPYKVIQKFEGGYELIEYPEQKWTSTKMTGEGSGPKNNSMFWKLFGYIDGKNSSGDKISMTVPVMIANEKQDNEMKREMQFYIPSKFQDSPPDPNDESVEVINRPPMIMYSKFLPGKPNFEEEAEKFRGELEKDGHTDADFSIFYSAGWDSPFKLINRRNEIMFRKVESDTSAAKTDSPATE